MSPEENETDYLLFLDICKMFSSVGTFGIELATSALKTKQMIKQSIC